MNIHVKNIREDSWESFKNEVIRISGSERPGFGKALSDALDYYVENVLTHRANKEWGGGVKKKLFKTEEKLKRLIQSLLMDLEEITPKFWTVYLLYDIEIGAKPYSVIYQLNENQIKHAIRQALSVVDRHTIRNYIDSLEASGFITWDNRRQVWMLKNGYKKDDRSELPEYVRIRRLRTDMVGTSEWEHWGKKEKKEKKPKKMIYTDVPIVVVDQAEA